MPISPLYESMAEMFGDDEEMEPYPDDEEAEQDPLTTRNVPVMPQSVLTPERRPAPTAPPPGPPPFPPPRRTPPVSENQRFRTPPFVTGKTYPGSTPDRSQDQQIPRAEFRPGIREPLPLQDRNQTFGRRPDFQTPQNPPDAMAVQQFNRTPLRGGSTLSDQTSNQQFNRPPLRGGPVPLPDQQQSFTRKPFDVSKKDVSPEQVIAAARGGGVDNPFGGAPSPVGGNWDTSQGGGQAAPPAAAGKQGVLAALGQLLQQSKAAAPPAAPQQGGGDVAAAQAKAREYLKQRAEAQAAAAPPQAAPPADPRAQPMQGSAIGAIYNTLARGFSRGGPAPTGAATPPFVAPSDPATAAGRDYLQRRAAAQAAEMGGAGGGSNPYIPMQARQGASAGVGSALSRGTAPPRRPRPPRAAPPATPGAAPTGRPEPTVTTPQEQGPEGSDFLPPPSQGSASTLQGLFGIPPQQQQGESEPWNGVWGTPPGGPSTGQPMGGGIPSGPPPPMEQQQMEEGGNGPSRDRPPPGQPPPPGPSVDQTPQNAGDAYRQQHRLNHQQHKGGFMSGVKHALQGIGMGAMAAGAGGNTSLGTILGGAIAGGVMGGVNGGLADNMYNRVIVDPEADRQLQMEIVRRNVEYERQKQGLTIDEIKGRLTGQKEQSEHTKFLEDQARQAGARADDAAYEASLNNAAIRRFHESQAGYYDRRGDIEMFGSKNPLDEAGKIERNDDSNYGTAPERGAKDFEDVLDADQNAPFKVLAGQYPGAALQEAMEVWGAQGTMTPDKSQLSGFKSQTKNPQTGAMEDHDGFLYGGNKAGDQGTLARAMEIRKKGEAALLRVLTANAEKQKRARIKQSYDEYIKQREAAVGQRKQTSSNTTSGKGTTRPVGQTRGLGTGINDFNDFTGKL